MTNILLSLPWPPPARATRPVVPVFLPYAGCPARCVFCAQPVQTGRAPASLAATLRAALACLRQRRDRGLPPAELAFYGGTFTAQPPAALRACLRFFDAVRRRGLAATFRCSTRPDAVDARRLALLRDAGCSLVELGVQSFDSAALAAASRGYDGPTARAACRKVTDSGMRLGVQLMPGMPGVTPEIFLRDMALLCARPAAVKAHAVRLYPCVVMEGTELARLWREGSYTPWTLETTLDALAEAWLMALLARMPVIRMGLAPEKTLAAALLDGPWDPALGARVMARALLRHVRRALAARGLEHVIRMDVPRRCQGFFWGARNELRAAWGDLGLLAPPRWISGSRLHIEARPASETRPNGAGEEKKLKGILADRECFCNKNLPCADSVACGMENTHESGMPREGAPQGKNARKRDQDKRSFNPQSPHPPTDSATDG